MLAILIVKVAVRLRLSITVLVAIRILRVEEAPLSHRRLVSIPLLISILLVFIRRVWRLLWQVVQPCQVESRVIIRILLAAREEIANRSEVERDNKAAPWLDGGLRVLFQPLFAVEVWTPCPVVKHG